MTVRRESRSMTACPSTIPSVEIRNYVSHGEGRSPFGSVRPVGRRTPMKRVPHCNLTSRKAIFSSEDLDIDVAPDSVVRKKSSKYRGVTK